MSTSMHFGASKTIFQYAEILRNKMTDAEKIIWEKLCNKQLGVRIRRQHPIWVYLADYYCHELKLVIEIDGGIHLKKEKREYDIDREVILNEFGIEIIRFRNDQVLKELDTVIERIIEKIEELKEKQFLKPNQYTKADKSPPV